MKISQKDLDLLVDSMMNEIYDRFYITREREKIADKALVNFRKTKIYKQINDILSNPFISYISVKEDIYDWTPAEAAGKTRYTATFYTITDLENNFHSRMSNRTKIDYPSEFEVRNKLRSTLAIELIWGSDLKKALADVAKAIKKEFKLS